MSITIQGIISRKASGEEHEGALFEEEFSSLKDAMGTAGTWIDKNQHPEVVCFYFYNNGNLIWTMTPNLR